MSNEWYTPQKYVDAARLVMGGIDLDPASCEFANRTVKATTYYTKEENGLMLPWFGRVWLNPPYGRTSLQKQIMSYQKAFAEKLLREYRVGNVIQAVLFSLGNPNTPWFQPFFDYYVCFNRGTIHFKRPDGTDGSFGFPLAMVYLGPHEQKFIEVFSNFGRVTKAVDGMKPLPTRLELWVESGVVA